MIIKRKPKKSQTKAKEKPKKAKESQRKNKKVFPHMFLKHIKSMGQVGQTEI